MDSLSQITLLDAARQWFRHCANSPNKTRAARQKARELERQCEAELGRTAAAMAGHSVGAAMSPAVRSAIMVGAITGQQLAA